jgi:AbrB family looped-hinge helix DNA binding protein
MNTSVVINGKVTIPSIIRKKYNIKKGTKVYFIDENNEIKIVPVTRELIKANFGIFKTKGNLLKALKEEKKKETK